VPFAAEPAVLRWLAIVLLLMMAPVTAPPAAAAAQDPSFDDAAIARAHEALQADPLLNGEKTIKTLRWRERQQTRASRPGWLLWMAGFFAWIGQSARYLVWAAAMILAVWLLRYIVTTAAHARSDDTGEAFVAPTHVRDLDIRPASLPPDIGGAARALWDAGQHRAALALLYRGLLSRLAHVHQVPIADFTTEGDCLRLSAAHLSAPRQVYASRLVGVWQHLVYGHEDVSGATVHELCEQFAPAIDRAATADERVALTPDGEVRT
jgi:hypothetical protein